MVFSLGDYVFFEPVNSMAEHTFTQDQAGIMWHTYVIAPLFNLMFNYVICVRQANVSPNAPGSPFCLCETRLQ